MLPLALASRPQTGMRELSFSEGGGGKIWVLSYAQDFSAQGFASINIYTAPLPPSTEPYKVISLPPISAALSMEGSRAGKRSFECVNVPKQQRVEYSL